MDANSVDSEAVLVPPGSIGTDTPRPSLLRSCWRGATTGFRGVSYVAGPIAAVGLILGLALTAFGVGSGRGWGLHGIVRSAFVFYLGFSLCGAILGGVIGLIEALIRRARPLSRTAAWLAAAKRPIRLLPGRRSTGAPVDIGPLRSRRRRWPWLVGVPVLVVLAADAAIRVHDGDPDGALDSCRAILGVGRSIGDEPFLISQLVRLAIGSVAMKSVRRVLGQGEPSDTALARIQALVHNELAEPLLLHVLKGERAIMTELIRRVGAGEVPISALSNNGTTFDPDGPRAPIAPWGKLLFDNQRAVELEWINELVAIARRPAAERPPLWKAWQTGVDRVKRSRLGPLTATLPLLLTPSLSASNSAHSRYQCELGTTAILLAAERQRRRTGDWPTAIAAIDPAILPSPPVDPFTGQPFRIEHGNGLLLIYSIGPDLQDDRGAYDPKQWMKGRPDDVGTGAWDVPLRRQPHARQDELPPRSTSPP
jgi:hypothetical protein